MQCPTAPQKQYDTTHGDPMTEPTHFEPHLIKQVRKSGDIYVGREHIGKTAYIYFVRGDEKE
jgi:hypothetical protein